MHKNSRKIILKSAETVYKRRIFQSVCKDWDDSQTKPGIDRNQYPTEVIPDIDADELQKVIKEDFELDSLSLDKSFDTRPKSKSGGWSIPPKLILQFKDQN